MKAIGMPADSVCNQALGVEHSPALTDFRMCQCSGFYRGLLPSLFGVSHGAVMFMAYEELRSMILDFTGEKDLVCIVTHTHTHPHARARAL
jgi:hypothetical protein